MGAHVGDDRDESGGLGFGRFTFEELEEFDFHALSFCVLRVHFGQAEVLAEASGFGLVVVELVAGRCWEAALSDKIVVEDAVNDQIGVATDGRREVGVVVFTETVVTIGRGSIGGFFETTQQGGAQDVALRMGLSLLEETDDFRTTREVADFQAKGRDVLA